jgi:hypothetical protein
VPKRRLTLAAAVIGLTMVSHAAAQTRSLADVLKLSAVYVSEFRQQLAGIVAEETYHQEVASTARISNSAAINPARTLKSDLLLIRPRDSNRYVELRDVFEVDGRPVRSRGSRLEALLRDPTAAASTTVQSIIAESAAYNIGSITRNVNTPLMALQFLDAAEQRRFRFTHVDKPKPVFKQPEDRAINDVSVFKVSTEMWTIEYQERGRNTIIRRPDGGDQPAHGRFWINPANGSVLISELVVDSGGVIATVTVSYQSEPLIGFLVPIEMRESYIRYGERISGRAEYGQFRQIQR